MTNIQNKMQKMQTLVRNGAGKGAKDYQLEGCLNA